MSMFSTFLKYRVDIWNSYVLLEEIGQGADIALGGRAVRRRPPRRRRERLHAFGEVELEFAEFDDGFFAFVVEFAAGVGGELSLAAHQGQIQFAFFQMAVDLAIEQLA